MDTGLTDTSADESHLGKPINTGDISCYKPRWIETEGEIEWGVGHSSWKFHLPSMLITFRLFAIHDTGSNMCLSGIWLMLLMQIDFGKGQTQSRMCFNSYVRNNTLRYILSIL